MVKPSSPLVIATAKDIVNIHMDNSSSKFDTPAHRELKFFMHDEFNRLQGRSSEAREFSYQTLVLWMAVARLHCVAGATASSLLELADNDGLHNSPFWSKLHSAAASILKNECTSMAFGPELLPEFAAFLVRIKQLIQSIGLDWWYADHIASELCVASSRFNPEAVVDTHVISLMFDALDAPVGSRVWFPFDRNGQLLSEAIRRELVPIGQARILNRGFITTYAPGAARLVLMLSLVGDRASLLDADGLLGPGSLFWSNEQPDFAVIHTPDNFSTTDSFAPTFELDEWVAVPGNSGQLEDFVRARKGDAASLSILLPYIKKKAVVLASPKILFSKGQEQRFRSSVMTDGMSLVSVLQLPKGTFVQSNYSGAVLLFDKGQKESSVRFIDCHTGFGNQSLEQLGRVLKVEGHNEYPWFHGMTTSTDLLSVADVNHEVIRSNDFSWLPARYCSLSESHDVPSVYLEQLVEIIRPAPILKQSLSAFESSEIGIPQLGRYRPISELSDKKGLVEKQKIESHRLINGDLVFSTKGTIGKCGLLALESQSSETIPVSSNSCVGLRVRDGANLKPEVLLMYLNSVDAKEQLKRLAVGTSVLALPLESIRKIAIPKDCLIGGLQGEKYLEAFQRLFKLEVERDAISDEISKIERETFISSVASRSAL